MIDKWTNECTGCGACSIVCPKQCIRMVSNDEGFIIPNIDVNECISCNLCESACPIDNNKLLHRASRDGVIGIKWNGDEESILRSASAGIVHALSKHVIRKGGIVAGAALLQNTVKHIIVHKEEDLGKLQNSKYVQSDTTDAIKHIYDLLNKDPDTMVLFCGTPCQCAAVKNLIGSIDNARNVYIVDFVCHGVPSPLLLSKYLEWVGRRIGETIKSFEFRYKAKGWNYHGYMSSYTKANDHIWATQKDPYMVNFLKETNYRESCYRCSFIDNKGADITVADFGGVKEIAPGFYDKKGCSTAIVHTLKGKELLDSILHECTTVEVDFNMAAKYNPHLCKPSNRPRIRDTIYEGINKTGYIEQKLLPQVSRKALLAFYLPEPIKKRIKSFSIWK